MQNVDILVLQIVTASKCLIASLLDLLFQIVLK